MENSYLLLPARSFTVEISAPFLETMKDITKVQKNASGTSFPDLSRKTYCVTTFGCQMNQHDSEALEGLLRRAGCFPADTPASADIILFNTCCVRDHAEQRLYSRISQLKDLKERRAELLIAIGGCAAQKEKEKLLERFPYVDIVFGPNAVPDILQLIEEVLQNGRPLVAVPEDGPAVQAADYSNGKTRLHAWVSIMRGCDNYCSYCIVPYVRGPQRSKKPADVVAEVKTLVRNGIREVTLLGQNVNSYGQDLDSDISFAHLLERLNEVSGLIRLRFTTSHPKDISVELMRAIRDLDKVCEHLHLPVQSGSSRVLQLMNRRYTAEAYIEKVAKLREFVPDISLTTDVIVGFPGETEEDFGETLALLQQVRFNGAYIFKYSPRQGTAAARMTDEISKEVITRRHGLLLDVQKKISASRLTELIHSMQNILPERPDPKRPGYLIGRTRGHRVGTFPASAELIGTEALVQIDRIDGWTLVGAK